MHKNKTIFFLGIISFLLIPAFSWAASSGFSSEFVSLEPKHPSEGQSIELSVSFVNHESAKLTGSLVFYNGGEKLGSRDIALASGAEETYSISWNAVLGTHEFYASAENLRLENSNVRILSPSTETLKVSIGFRDSEVADKLREKGGAGVITAGVWQELENFFVPTFQSVDEWRFNRIAPLEQTQVRIHSDKTNAEGKIKPILVMHGIVLVVFLFVLRSKIIFFVLFGVVLLWLLVKIVKRIKGLFRKKYTEEDA